MMSLPLLYSFFQLAEKTLCFDVSQAVSIGYVLSLIWPWEQQLLSISSRVRQILSMDYSSALSRWSH